MSCNRPLALKERLVNSAKLGARLAEPKRLSMSFETHMMIRRRSRTGDDNQFTVEATDDGLRLVRYAVRQVMLHDRLVTHAKCALGHTLALSKPCHWSKPLSALDRAGTAPGRLSSDHPPRSGFPYVNLITKALPIPTNPVGVTRPGTKPHRFSGDSPPRKGAETGRESER